MNTFPVAGYKGTVKKHWGSNIGGSDLFAPAGTPVLAMVDGVVSSADYSPLGGWNLTIQGDDGQQYYYAHLVSQPYVGANTRVQAGQQIGAVGDTGNAKGTGPHLHIGIGKSIVNGSGAAGGTGTNYDAVAALTNAEVETTSSAVALTTAGGAQMPDPLDAQLGADATPADVGQGGVTTLVPADLAELQRVHGGRPPIVTKISPDTDPATGLPVQRPIYRYDYADKTYITMRGVEGSQGSQGPWEVVNAGTALDMTATGPAQETKYITHPDGSQWGWNPDTKTYDIPLSQAAEPKWTYVERPDGLWRENAQTGQREFVSPIAAGDAGKWQYVERGGRLWREDAVSGTRQDMGAVPQDPERPGVAEGRDLQNRKMRQDLIPPISKLLQDQEAAIQYIQGEMSAGRMNSQQANDYMANIHANTQAALKGTTIFQQQEADRRLKVEQQQMGASMLNQRVSSGGSILNGIFQSLQGVMMPKGQSSLGIDPVQMVQQALNTFGGGQESYAFAKGLLMGAGIGQEGVKAAAQGGAMPGGPAVGQQAPAAAQQQPVDTEAVWRQIQADPRKYGLLTPGTSPYPAQSSQPNSPLVGPGVGWPPQPGMSPPPPNVGG